MVFLFSFFSKGRVGLRSQFKWNEKWIHFFWNYKKKIRAYHLGRLWERHARWKWVLCVLFCMTKDIRLITVNKPSIDKKSCLNPLIMASLKTWLAGDLLGDFPSFVTVSKSSSFLEMFLFLDTGCNWIGTSNTFLRSSWHHQLHLHHWWHPLGFIAVEMQYVLVSIMTAFLPFFMIVFFRLVLQPLGLNSVLTKKIRQQKAVFMKPPGDFNVLVSLDFPSFTVPKTSYVKGYLQNTFDIYSVLLFFPQLFRH